MRNLTRTTICTWIGIVTALGGGPSATLAKEKEETEPKETSQIYIETDPTAPFFGGFSVAIRRSSTLLSNLSLGFGYYQTELPDFYIESKESNVGKGWSANSKGVDFFADYFFFDPNEGLSLGLVASVYRFGLERREQSAAYTSFAGTLRAGYLWRPFPWKTANAFYVYPWVGVAGNTDLGGTKEIDGETFELPRVSFVPALQLGFSF